jgi:biotin carboxyl carrier protein
LTAPRDGVVAEVGAQLGELVTDGALLVRLEETEKKS